MTRTNHVADATADMLRVSMDVKAMVKIGPFARIVELVTAVYETGGTLTKDAIQRVEA